MASYSHAPPAMAPRPAANTSPFNAASASTTLTIHAGAVAPAGTFQPGTKIQVGSHRVIIQKYLSEGGFAHVYLVKLPTPSQGTDLAVLKRVAVPDKETLKGMRTEVETMKRLKGHKPIVTYMDSHASELRGGGYEVFLLMEYCDGGGLIDFMNTRLQHRLAEAEILQIFTDVAEGVACMHYLRPALLHRDLKVENVLIKTGKSGKKEFKLCDFGSAAPPRPAPKNIAECRAMDEDVQKHTTMQYRSPEMVDVHRMRAIDEKSDIWALGVLLYKLCYYTTPFEEQGQLAILNASYKFPSYPSFSERLRKLIASMLKEDQTRRPNIYQVLTEACAMQGRQVPMKDIYGGKTTREEAVSSKDKPLPAKKTAQSASLGAVISHAKTEEQKLPDVVPMRRGRLPTTSQVHGRTDASPKKVTSGDPFAALDARGANGKSDELSARFPSLDQFSLLHDKSSKFDFEGQKSPELKEKVVEALADDAFATSRTASQRTNAPTYSKANPALTTAQQSMQPPVKPASAPPKPVEASRVAELAQSKTVSQVIPSTKTAPKPPTKPVMVSTGTMTMEPPVSKPGRPYQIFTFPSSDRQRSSSQPRQSTTTDTTASTSVSMTTPLEPVTSAPTLRPPHTRKILSSRPSLEGKRPSAELLAPIVRTESRSNRPRPASTHLESSLDYLRDRENVARASPSPRIIPSRTLEKPSPLLLPLDDDDNKEELTIESNVEFLRAMEESDDKKTRHGKRSSISSLGKKAILGGKFGDVFKKFESNQPPTIQPPRTPSPLKDIERRDLTPITGSEATDGRSDDGRVLEEAEDMTPAERREIERRRLSMEEKRVAAAGAEYRARLAQKGSAPMPPPKSIGGVSRAVSIQRQTQRLLDESTRGSKNVPKTASGYGSYSDAAFASTQPEKPEVGRKPVLINNTAVAVASSLPARPTAPPKPTHLNKAATISVSAPSSDPHRPQHTSSAPPAANSSAAGMRSTGRLEHLIAADMPGQPVLDISAAEKEDYMRDFSKRFPSLGAIEMVEMDLPMGGEARRDR